VSNYINNDLPNKITHCGGVYERKTRFEYCIETEIRVMLLALYAWTRRAVKCGCRKFEWTQLYFSRTVCHHVFDNCTILFFLLYGVLPAIHFSSTQDSSYVQLSWQVSKSYTPVQELLVPLGRLLFTGLHLPFTWYRDSSQVNRVFCFNVLITQFTNLW
jgi:hypothetical protein